jgi:hypothetical protein
MKTRTTIMLVAAAVALSFAFTAIVTPKAVKAAIDTLIRDQDNKVRHPFTATCTSAFTTSSTISCNTDPIPAGEEVAIETISFQAAGDPTNVVLNPSVVTTEATVDHTYFLTPPGEFQLRLKFRGSGAATIRECAI